MAASDDLGDDIDLASIETDDIGLGIIDAGLETGVTSSDFEEVMCNSDLNSSAVTYGDFGADVIGAHFLAADPNLEFKLKDSEAQMMLQWQCAHRDPGTGEQCDGEQEEGPANDGLEVIEEHLRVEDLDVEEEELGIEGDLAREDGDLSGEDGDLTREDGDLGGEDGDEGVEDEHLGMDDEDLCVDDEEEEEEEEDLGIEEEEDLGIEEGEDFGIEEEEDLGIEEEDLGIEEEDLGIEEEEEDIGIEEEEDIGIEEEEDIGIEEEEEEDLGMGEEEEDLGMGEEEEHLGIEEEENLGVEEEGEDLGLDEEEGRLGVEKEEEDFGVEEEEDLGVEQVVAEQEEEDLGMEEEVEDLGMEEEDDAIGVEEDEEEDLGMGEEEEEDLVMGEEEEDLSMGGEDLVREAKNIGGHNEHLEVGGDNLGLEGADFAVDKDLDVKGDDLGIEDEVLEVGEENLRAGEYLGVRKKVLGMRDKLLREGAEYLVEEDEDLGDGQKQNLVVQNEHWKTVGGDGTITCTSELESHKPEIIRVSNVGGARNGEPGKGHGNLDVDRNTEVGDKELANEERPLKLRVNKVDNGDGLSADVSEWDHFNLQLKGNWKGESKEVTSVEGMLDLQGSEESQKERMPPESQQECDHKVHRRSISRHTSNIHREGRAMGSAARHSLLESRQLATGTVKADNGQDTKGPPGLPYRCVFCNYWSSSVKGLRVHQQHKHYFCDPSCPPSPGFISKKHELGNEAEDSQAEVCTGATPGPNQGTEANSGPTRKRLRIDEIASTLKSRIQGLTAVDQAADPSHQSSPQTWQTTPGQISESKTEEHVEEDEEVVEHIGMRGSRGKSLVGIRANPFGCRHCGFKGATPRAVSTHYQRMHPHIKYTFRYIAGEAGASEAYRCLECQAEAPTLASLKRHYNARHPGARFLLELERPGGILYRCLACPYTNANVRGMMPHYQRVHPGLPISNSLIYSNFITTDVGEDAKSSSVGKNSGSSLGKELISKLSDAGTQQIGNSPGGGTGSDPQSSGQKVRGLKLDPQSHNRGFIPGSKGMIKDSASLSRSPAKTLQSASTLMTYRCDLCHYGSLNIHSVLIHYQKAHPGVRASYSRIRRIPASSQSSGSQSGPMRPPDVLLQPSEAFYCAMCSYANKTLKGVLVHYQKRHPGQRITGQLVRCHSEKVRARIGSDSSTANREVENRTTKPQTVECSWSDVSNTSAVLASTPAPVSMETWSRGRHSEGSSSRPGLWSISNSSVEVKTEQQEISDSFSRPVSLNSNLTQRAMPRTTGFTARPRSHDFTPRPISRGPDLAMQPVPRGSDLIARNVSRGSDFTVRPISRGPDMTARPFSQGSDFNSRPSSRGPDFTARPASRGPDFSVRPASRGPDFSVRPVSKGPDFTNRPASKGTDFTTRPFSQSSDLSTQPVSRGPDLNARPFSRGPDLNARPVSRGTDFTSRPIARGPDFASRPVGREPELTLQPASRDPGSAAQFVAHGLELNKWPGDRTLDSNTHHNNRGLDSTIGSLSQNAGINQQSTNRSLESNYITQPSCSYTTSPPTTVSYSCRHCASYSCTNLHGLLTHYGKKHPGVQVRASDFLSPADPRYNSLFRCRLCPYVNVRLHGVLTHYQKRHPKVRVTAEACLAEPRIPVPVQSTTAVLDSQVPGRAAYGLYRCSECDFGHASFARLATHYRRVHPGHSIPQGSMIQPEASKPQDLSQATLLSPGSPSPLDLPPAFSCRLCPYVCGTRKGIARHYRVRHASAGVGGLPRPPGSLFSCSLCPYSHPLRKGLASHYQKRHGNLDAYYTHCLAMTKAGRTDGTTSWDASSESQASWGKVESGSGPIDQLNNKSRPVSQPPVTNPVASQSEFWSSSDLPDAQPLQIGPAETPVSAKQDYLWPCSLCAFRTDNRKGIVSHYLKRHPGLYPKKKYDSKLQGYFSPVYADEPGSNGIDADGLGQEQKRRCVVCAGLEFEYPALLASHYHTNHSQQLPYGFQIQPGAYCCNHCSFTCTELNILVTHLDTHGPSPDTNGHSVERARQVCGYRCVFCSEMHHSMKAIANHLRKHIVLRDGVILPVARSKLSSASAVSPAWHTGEQFTPPVKEKTEEKEGNDARRDGRFSCNQCSFTTNFKHNMLRHVQNRHGRVKPFRCKLCSFQTGYKTCLASHTQRLHPNGNAYRCSLCSFATNSLAQLSSHGMATHGRPIAPLRPPVRRTVGSPPACPPDGSPSVYPPACSPSPPDPPIPQPKVDELEEGERRLDLMDSPSGRLSPDHLFPSSGLSCPAMPPFACEFCIFTSPYIQSIRRHYRDRHNGCRLAKCKDCPYFTGDRDAFEDHITSCHRGVPGSGAEAFEGGAIDSHPEPNPEFQCPFCLYSSKVKDNLILHVLLHREERAWPAEVRRSRVPRSLRGRILRCPMCTFSCGSRQMLRTHRARRHGGLGAPVGSGRGRGDGSDGENEGRTRCLLCRREERDGARLTAHLMARHQVERNFEILREPVTDGESEEEEQQEEEEEEESESLDEAQESENAVGEGVARRFPCEFCGRSFSLGSDWMRHVQRHGQAFPLEEPAEGEKPGQLDKPHLPESTPTLPATTALSSNT
uniref:zinc finger protein 462-like isoform X2 n=1 Tax=Myxine glutinosa TaxID=7769 RepID=UPI00358FF5D9